MVDGEGVFEGEAFARGMIGGFGMGGVFGGDAEAAGDVLMGGDAELALIAVGDAEDDFLKDGTLEIAVWVDGLEGGKGGEDARVHGEGLDHLGDREAFGEELGAFLEGRIIANGGEVFRDDDGVDGDAHFWR